MILNVCNVGIVLIVKVMLRTANILIGTVCSGARELKANSNDYIQENIL